MNQQWRMSVRYSLSLYPVRHLPPEMQILCQIAVFYVVNQFPAALSHCKNSLGVTNTGIPTFLSADVDRKFKLLKIVMIVIIFNI